MLNLRTKKRYEMHLTGRDLDFILFSPLGLALRLQLDIQLDFVLEQNQIL